MGRRMVLVLTHGALSRILRVFVLTAAALQLTAVPSVSWNAAQSQECEPSLGVCSAERSLCAAEASPLENCSVPSSACDSASGCPVWCTTPFLDAEPGPALFGKNTQTHELPSARRHCDHRRTGYAQASSQVLLDRLELRITKPRR